MVFKRSILVVDDDPMIVHLLTEYLTQQGHKVTTAPDGMQAVIQAKALRPVLIISDIQMPPWGTGIEAYEEMKKESSLANIPVIFMTGIPPEKAKAMVPIDPKVRLIGKPINWVMLEQAMSELVGEAPPQDAK